MPFSFVVSTLREDNCDASWLKLFFSSLVEPANANHEPQSSEINEKIAVDDINRWTDNPT